jgi:hypothetical protein
MKTFIGLFGAIALCIGCGGSETPLEKDLVAAASTKLVTCGPGTCNGCCGDPNGNTCFPGGSNAECGNSGFPCDQCDGFDTVCVRGPPKNLLACRPRGGGFIPPDPCGPECGP